MKITLTEQDYAAIEREAANVMTGNGNTAESYGEASVVWVVREPERRCNFWMALLRHEEMDDIQCGLRMHIRCRDEIEKDGKKFRRRWGNGVVIEANPDDITRLWKSAADCLVEWANEFIDDYPEDGLLPLEENEPTIDGARCASAN